MKKLLLWIVFSLCLMGVAAAETILVDPGGAGDYESITEALSAAQDGDELILAGGVYDETRETFPILVEKSVVMRAAEGEEPVIMPPQQVAGLELAAPGIELNGVRVDFLRSGLWVMADDVRVLFFPEAGMPGDNPGFERVVLVDGDGGRVNPSELGMRFSCAPVEGHVEEHALFAGPSHREWESWEHPYEDWEILLQVDSFDGEGFTLNFMDCGVLDFLISPQDLAARRFDRVRAIVLST